MNTAGPLSALAGLPPRFLRTPEAARFLGLSSRTLEKHRTYGTGPKYSKVGGRIIYAIDDLKAWADLGAKRSTSDPGKGTVFPMPVRPGTVREEMPTEQIIKASISRISRRPRRLRHFPYLSALCNRT